MEYSESKRLEGPYSHYGEKQQHKDEQNGQAVTSVNRLCPLVANVQAHLGKLKGSTQIQSLVHIVQHHAQVNPFADVAVVYKDFADRRCLARVDMEGRVAERLLHG